MKNDHFLVILAVWVLFPKFRIAQNKKCHMQLRDRFFFFNFMREVGSEECS